MPTLDNKAVYFDLKGELEEREDCWAARHAELGITVYGQTASEASNRMRTAVDLLVSDFTRDELVQYLKDRGIECTMVSQPLSFTQSHVLAATDSSR